MARELPARPNLEHLKKQAKALRRERGLGTLADAQHLLAREYGFQNWSSLKHQVLQLAAAADPVAAFVSAVMAGDTETVGDLFARFPALKAKVDDSLPGFPFDSTALIRAAVLGNRALIDLLLEAGADINQKSRWWAGGFGPLDHASPEIAAFLLERGARLEINAAAKLGMTDRVAELLRVDPALAHARGGDGQTPLHLAANVEIAQMLIDRGAGLDTLDVDHESTPAQYLIAEHQDVVRLLIERGCRTDILMAAALGDDALVRAYLERDPASIRTTASNEYFPMENPRAGGTIYIWTLGGNKPAHVVAQEFGHDSTFRLLMQHTPESLQFALAAEAGDRALVERLTAERPGIVGSLSTDERLRLIAAAQDNRTDAVALMLDAGWPATVHRANGVTALHWAAHHGNAEMVRALLRHGASIDARESTFNGRPLGWAFHGSQNGWFPKHADYPATVAALLDAGGELPPADDIEASEPVLALLRQRGVDV